MLHVAALEGFRRRAGSAGNDGRRHRHVTIDKDFSDAGRDE